jgi:hypothetical protein
VTIEQDRDITDLAPPGSERRGPIPPDQAATPGLLALARLLLAAATGVVAYGVFAPAGYAISVMPWDKAEHFTAFFGLTALSIVSFPRAPIWRPAAMLSVVGGMVELIQALPFTHRDCDWKDWAADTLGVLAVLGVVFAARMRRSLAAVSDPHQRTGGST